jgi:hypothetical protein
LKYFWIVNNKDRNTKIVLIAITSMIVIMGTTTLVPVLQQQQANAASLRQHSNLLNNCYRPDLCRQSNVDQGTAGNDNQVTGFGDLSDTSTTNNTSTANSAAQGPQGPKGDPGTKGDPGPAGPDKILSTREVFGEFKTGGFGFIGATAECAGDEAVTGGGYDVTPAGLGVEFFVTSNHRITGGSNGWSVVIFHNSTSDIALTPFAECAKLVPPP